MSCTPKNTEENYSFFQSNSDYAEKANKAEHDSISSDYTSGCDNFSSDFGTSKIDLVGYCKKFKYFFHLISPDKRLTKPVSDENAYRYLNYWINYLLKKNSSNSTICVETFYNKLKVYDTSFDNENTLKDKIYDIKKNDLQYMNILNNLHTYYENIYSKITDSNVRGIHSSCSNDNQKCIEKYEEVILNCPDVGDNTHFCTALSNFKEKYEKLQDHINIPNECSKIVLKKLPTYSEVIDKYRITSQKWNGENAGVITMFPIFWGIIIIIFLTYKLKLLGTWIHPLFRKFKLVRHNNNVEEQPSFIYSSETNYTNTQDIYYNIGY
ncbi:PIR Superfamily Protein [Plasmodium ovale wallikeri]|uniref:PIR Superfamily Protein n=1 Tax=Plasmodium ovale wallikeri TaxID=864142 RepID=A0A1A9AFE7_PLAOA|nr:PIR Superfamily Protein [Plasmodium ovale wallikeri]SBT59055.1 PIR Superfamily Protein [Plasmodium ovale wallikeri]